MSACDIPSDDPHHQAMGLTLGLQVVDRIIPEPAAQPLTPEYKAHKEAWDRASGFRVVWLCPDHYKEWTGRTVDPYMDSFGGWQP